MAFYTPEAGAWTRVQSRPDGTYIHVPDDLLNAPALVLFEGDTAVFTLENASPSPDAETVHTVAALDADAMHGTLLCVYVVEEGDASLVDLRSAASTTDTDDLVAGIEEALDDILLPVYIDDAVQEGTEDADSLIGLLTVQPGGSEPPYSYARVAVFRSGELLLEEEAGSL